MASMASYWHLALLAGGLIIASYVFFRRKRLITPLPKPEDVEARIKVLTKEELDLIERNFGNNAEPVLFIIFVFELASNRDLREIVPAAAIGGLIDSLSEVELVMVLEDRYRVEIPDADAQTFKRVGDIINYAGQFEPR